MIFSKDLIPLLDQDDDSRATLMALNGLGKLYPDTFRVLLLAAKEALRPMDGETRLDGHTPAPMAMSWEACVCGRQLGPSTESNCQDLWIKFG